MLPSHARVVVVGGGPAGYMAAITAAEAGVTDVLVLEATREPLQKVRISGGGRCNVTHACWDPAELVQHYPRGGRALRGPFSRFAAGDTVAWFAARGLELVAEDDGRMFPRANRSVAVVACLRRAAAAAGVRTFTQTAAVGVERRGDGQGFRLLLRGGGTLSCERLVLASGSHPSGQRIAAALGHSLVPPAPSLFTLALAEQPLAGLAGLTIDPVGLELETTPGRPAMRQRGALLITHWGLSGPATLRLTAFAARELRQTGYRGMLRIDWTGGVGAAALHELLERTRREQARRSLGGARPWPALPRRLWMLLLERQGVDPKGRWADLSRARQRRLEQALLASRYRIAGRGPFGEEFVTAGGVPPGEVNLRAMESRRQPGLHLVGELLDVDGVTGGFNFQHCWTSGWLAGKAIAASCPAADGIT